MSTVSLDAQGALALAALEHCLKPGFRCFEKLEVFPTEANSFCVTARYRYNNGQNKGLRPISVDGQITVLPDGNIFLRLRTNNGEVSEGTLWEATVPVKSLFDF